MTDQVTAGTQATAETQTQTETQQQTTQQGGTQDTLVTQPNDTQPKSWIADDWREKLSNGDQKELQRLQRFSDVGALFNSFRELEKKVSSGQVKFNLQENATPEQIAAYRQQNGIPESPDGYQLEDIQIGEQDEPIVGLMLEAMHQDNLPNKTVNNLVNAFYKARELEAAEMAEREALVKQNSQEELRTEWGGNYLANMSSVKNLINTMGDAGVELMSARLSDGSLLGNNAAIIKALSAIATELNPAGTVVPGSNGNQLQSIKEELASLSDLMKKDIQAWHKNLPAKARHRELLEAEAKLTARGF